jgi:hypothetical protein
MPPNKRLLLALPPVHDFLEFVAFGRRQEKFWIRCLDGEIVTIGSHVTDHVGGRNALTGAYQ